MPEQRAKISESGLIHELVAEWARRTPHAPALRHAGSTLTYGELDAAADRMAARLERARIGPGAIVPVLLPRSAALAVALLGILKRGAAYAALDPSWPTARLDALVTRMGAARIVTEQESTPGGSQRISAAVTSAHEEAPPTPVEVTPGTPASVFFTSGSTGEPKGALCPHSGTVRLFRDCQFADLGPHTVMPLAAAVPWDALTLELWGVLLAGGCVVVVDEPYLLPATLRSLTIEHGVNSLFLTPTLFNVFVDEDVDAFEGVRQVFVGGEKVSSRHLAALLSRYPRMRIVHGYGPVESTLFVTTHQVRPIDCTRPEGVPLGVAVPGTGLHVWDGDRLCGTDESGELLVSGTGLATGYLGLPELTARRFPTLKLDGVLTRVYRTGDRVRRTADGHLFFEGRIDRQVKIRGHRVEPGEIERVTSALSGVRQCAVVPIPDGTGGYGALGLAYTATSVGPADADLFAHLRSRLPAYLVPRSVIRLESLPMNANGKTDAAALLRLLNAPTVVGPEPDAPATATERLVASVFAEVLGVDRVPCDDDFFALGGTSLGLGVVCARLSASRGAPLPLGEVVRNRSVRALADWLDYRTSHAAEENLEPTGPVRLNGIQEGFWTRQATQPEDVSGLCLLGWRTAGVLNTDALARALADLSERHEALRCVYGLDNKGAALVAVPRPAGPPVLDLLTSAPDERTAAAALQAALVRPLDPEQGQVWRAAHVPLAGSGLLGLAVHHVAFDGGSVPVLLADLGTAYAARLRGEPPRFATAAPTLRDVQREVHTARSVLHPANGRRFWRRELDGVPELALPVPAEPAGAGSAAQTLTCWIDTADSAAVRALARQHGTTAFTVLLAACASALRAATGQCDFAIGVPVSRRSSPLLASVVGCLVDTVAVRFRDPDTGWEQQLHATRRAASAALAHQDLSFVEVVQLVNPARTGREPIFQVLFAYQDTPVGALDLGGPAVALPMPAPAGVTELVTEIWPQPDGSLQVDLTHRTDAVADEFSPRFRDLFLAAVDNAVRSAPPAPMADPARASRA